MDDDIGFLEGLAAFAGLAGLALLVLGAMLLAAPIVSAAWNQVNNPPFALLMLGGVLFFGALLIDKIDGYRKKQTDKADER